jgi:hypothetical protein
LRFRIVERVPLQRTIVTRFGLTNRVISYVGVGVDPVLRPILRSAAGAVLELPHLLVPSPILCRLSPSRKTGESAFGRVRICERHGDHMSEQHFSKTNPQSAPDTERA